MGPFTCQRQERRGCGRSGEPSRTRGVPPPGRSCGIRRSCGERCRLTFPYASRPPVRESGPGAFSCPGRAALSCPRGAHRPQHPDPRAIDLSVPTGVSVPAWALSGGPVPREPLVAFAAAVFRRLGATRLDARHTAETLVLADVRGHPSHGVSRLRQYTRLIASGAIDPAARRERVARRTALKPGMPITAWGRRSATARWNGRSPWHDGRGSGRSSSEMPGTSAWPAPTSSARSTRA